MKKKKKKKKKKIKLKPLKKKKTDFEKFFGRDYKIDFFYFKIHQKNGENLTLTFSIITIK